MSEILGWVVLCFHALGTPLLYWNAFKIEILLRITFNFESLCVSSLAKSLPDNSHWYKRFQSTTLWDGNISHLQAEFCLLLLESCISDAILCVVTRSRRNLAKKHSICWSIHNCTWPSYPPFYGHQKKKHFICGKEAKPFPFSFPQFYLLPLGWGRFSS